MGQKSTSSLDFLPGKLRYSTTAKPVRELFGGFGRYEDQAASPSRGKKADSTTYFVIRANGSNGEGNTF
jgi:hypothetical protein